MDRNELLHALAALDDAEYQALTAEARGTADPKEIAVQALRRHRGVDRTTKASKQTAAGAVYKYVKGSRD